MPDDKPFRWHIFEDGYGEFTRGYDDVELQHMNSKHGHLVNILSSEEVDKINRGSVKYETLAP